MYYFRQDVLEKVKAKYKSSWICKEVGISNAYVSLILNDKKSCPKRIAYCITKAIDKNAEIMDYFYQKED